MNLDASNVQLFSENFQRFSFFFIPTNFFSLVMRNGHVLFIPVPNVYVSLKSSHILKVFFSLFRGIVFVIFVYSNLFTSLDGTWSQLIRIIELLLQLFFDIQFLEPFFNQFINIINKRTRFNIGIVIYPSVWWSRHYLIHTVLLKSFY